MTSQLLIVVVLIVLVAIGIAAWAYLQKRRTGELRQRFGSEYDHTVEQSGERRTGERVLQEREKRVEALNLHPLSDAERVRFSDEWRSIQARFVDDPAGAADQADRIIGAVMEERGYPMTDFDQRAADISVEHPDVVTNYRSAHTIALRAKKGEATTDELRAALINYRALFQELVETTPTQPTEVR
jgi:hypothetical protein